jgi:urea carboxylase
LGEKLPVFQSVLIANRGAIACRVIRTLDRMGVNSVVVFSDADADALHVRMATRAMRIGPPAAAESYLNASAILDAAAATGAEAIHPGYGFLSENAAFAEACEARGIAFIGPTPDQIRRFGLKHEARALAAEAGVPLLGGSLLLGSIDEARAAAAVLGYPVMLKSTAGGGGIGLRVCPDEATLIAEFDRVRSLGQSFFAESGVFLERYIPRARHVEVQIFGDGRGTVAALGERDCSIQRRNQKVVEEAPAPGLTEATRSALHDAARLLGQSVGYRSAGTVEFIIDSETGSFAFLEVNTRLQVEHGVTEAVLGVDLVEWMVRTAAGDPPPLGGFTPAPPPNGHAIQMRVYAEDPGDSFKPGAGTLTEVRLPEGVRADGWVETGTEVSPYYDPLLVKLIVHGPDRDAAVSSMRAALDDTRLAGISTNLNYLRTIAEAEGFATGIPTTRFLDGLPFAPNAVRVLEPGTYTTVQDYPGRVGYWRVGVPPSGPMDALAFRLANRIAGNTPDAAALEVTLTGPVLRFETGMTIALTGADMAATVDGAPIPRWSPVAVRAGSVLRMEASTGPGARAYVAFAGGIDVPVYLGSRATFALGQFGGQGGRPLRSGDLLEIGAVTGAAPAPSPLPADLVPAYGHEWEVGVLYGPHGAPDFFTNDAIEMFFGTAWEVHYNSNRLGMRLIGPKPTWARRDGGEAGLHPSNIHDCEYAVGSVNFTGDMPIVLTCDGPSLGGFVCPATIITSELWKIGQAKPGDRIRFRRTDFTDALAREQAQDAMIASLTAPPALAPTAPRAATGPILHTIPEAADQVAVAYRQAGDKYVLIEYGPNVLDLRFRFRVHALTEYLNANPVPGIIELSPGVRSLQVNYDSRIITQGALMDALLAAERALPPVGAMRVKTRIVRLPMAFEDEATLAAVAKYRQSVRDTAPWLPRNAEFMRRINGLDSVEQVRDIIFSASYMVLGLGDVYLGAPCAVPVDPRHRLLTSKYNPARTFTPEGTVGIGGVYMCIYGMDSPGGYQLVGRTLPIWNKFVRNPDFADGLPWLLRFFDQVRFYPVTEAELTEEREAFRQGRARLEITEEIFDLGEHLRFLDAIEPDVARFRAKQKAAFDAEVERWHAEPEWIATNNASDGDDEAVAVGPDERAVCSAIAGNVWKMLVEPGQDVAAGETVAVIEAMKMEFAVAAPEAGRIARVACRPGTLVQSGQVLAVMAPA